MSSKGGAVEYRFDRHELAGALGDLGTMLPIAIGLTLINGLDTTAVLFTAGLFYICAGLYFRIPVPVQPMKVIGAYAIARHMTPLEISTAGLLVGVFLLLLGAAGAITIVGRYVPRPAVRGVQLTTGILLLAEGVRFVLGESAVQSAHGAAEPFLTISEIGPIPIGPVLGVAALVTILLLLKNRRAPASLVVVGAAALLGVALGGYSGIAAIRPGLHLPSFLPYGLPDGTDLAFVMLALVLPQLPMTIGNAVVAEADLSKEYFGEAARRVTLRGLSLSMGVANVITAALGGMPLCHGSGGLAAHYRFGARTAGSNLIVGFLFLVLALVLGSQADVLLRLIPFSVLGVLLVFAGVQLALTIRDVTERSDLFVVLVILGVSLASNLGAGFAIGILLGWGIRRFAIAV